MPSYLPKPKMDGWAIRAELKRRGVSFKAMALESGLSASTLYGSLVKPSTNANRFIALKLNLTTHELWPDWFYPDGVLIPLKERQRRSRVRRGLASPESVAA